MPPRGKRGGVCSPPGRSGILDRLELAVERDVGRRLVVDDVKIVFELLALGFHWPPTSGVVHTFGTGFSGPPFQVSGPTSEW